MIIDGIRFTSRLLLGSAGYPSLTCLSQAVRASGAGLLTVSLRREAGVSEGFSDFLAELSSDVRILPNTSGCFSAREAILTAVMAREIFQTRLIKLEVTGDSQALFPDSGELLKAAEELISQDFCVLPYTNDDPVVASKLLEAGCDVLMPLAAPIGSAQGPANLSRLRYFRQSFPQATLIVDAGLGRPSHAAIVMEEGFDGVLVNTAVAKSGNPVAMAKSFAMATEAGRLGCSSVMPEPTEAGAASSPLKGLPFLNFT